MPDFTKHLRRLSSGFTGRRKSAQSDAANDDAIPKPAVDSQQQSSQPSRGANDPPSANRLLTRTLRFEDECETPPPAYSFVEDAGDDQGPSTGRLSVDAPAQDDDEVATPPLTPDTPLSAYDAVYFGESRQRALSIDEAISRPTTPAIPDTATSGNKTKLWLPDPSTFDANLLSLLPAEIWMSVVSHLDTASAASLAMSTRALAYRIGTPVFTTLNDPSNTASRAQFLEPSAKKLPNHILCHACGRFHARIAPGTEKLRSKDSYARHPLTTCRVPSATPAVRLTHDRNLPFPLAHLATAPLRHGPDHGISTAAISKSWTSSAPSYDGAWTHRTTFATTASTLLMRVTSTFHAPPALTPVEQRLILLNRTDYSANFSTCAHEARGATLFRAARCALGHVPALARANAAGGVVSQCAGCRRLWRCNLCPSEYSVEVKLVEDRARRRRGSGAGLPSPSAESPGLRFRYALIVTRWTALGTCAAPREPEWAACALQATYADEGSAVFPHAELGVRRTFERAVNERECLVVPVLMRRPCHWRSQRGWDLETFVQGSDMA